MRFAIAIALQLVDTLFRYYFQEGRNVGDRAVLEDAAAAAGLDRAAIRAFLASDSGQDEVMSATRTARANSVGGVPHYVFGDNTYALTGGQTVAVFEQVLRGMARQARAAHL